MKASAKIFLKTLEKEVLSKSPGLISAAFFRSLVIEALGRKLRKSPFSFLTFPAAVQGLKLMTEISESAKKYPEKLSEKVTTGKLAEQGISGALAGALLYKANGNKAYKGALIGGVAALAAVYASYYFKQKAAKSKFRAGPVLKVVGNSLAGGAKKLAS